MNSRIRVNTLVQTRKAIHSSSIKAIKYYGHSAVIMDEEQLTKESKAFIILNIFISIAILMAVLVRKTKLPTTIKKDLSLITAL